jgi:hypothetical protein
MTDDPLHATIEDFAAEGYTHIEANCPRCRRIRLRPIDQLPKISMGLHSGRAFYKAPLRNMRWPASVDQAVEAGRYAGQATRTQRLAWGFAI